MQKKILTGALLVVLLWCAPAFRMDLTSDASDTHAASENESDTRPALPPPAPDPEEPEILSGGKYTHTLMSSAGLLTYYNQNDKRWAGDFYGGEDKISVYGCGPTVLAMLVTSFTDQTCLPSDMAEWAADHGYWSPGSGTKHEFIIEGAEAFGFQAKAFKKYTKEDILSELSDGHILVALMGPGHFTRSGHFIIISDYWSGSKVSVADPASLENTQKPWKLQTILDELSYGVNAGGPLWSISLK